MPQFIGGLVVGVVLTLMVVGVLRATRFRHENEVWRQLEELLEEKVKREEIK